jgi:hypothetical protein
MIGFRKGTDRDYYDKNRVPGGKPSEDDGRAGQFEKPGKLARFLTPPSSAGSRLSIGIRPARPNFAYAISTPKELSDLKRRGPLTCECH